MAWNEKDAPRFRKGLKDKDAKKWVAIANAALAQCVEKKGEPLECEIQAVRIANAKFDDPKLSEKAIMQFSEQTKAFIQKTREEPAQVLLAAADAPPSEDGYQLVLPTGRYFTTYYGEVIFTKLLMEAMVANWKKRTLNERDPFIDTNHDFGQANGWIVDLRANDDGLWAKIDWTEPGKELVAKKIYRYFSVAFGSKLDIETGESVFPVLEAVSLTNVPAINTLPHASLSEGGNGESLDGMKGFSEDGSNKTDGSAHGDGADTNKEGDDMEFAEVLNTVAKISDDEKKVLIRQLGLSEVVGERDTLRQEKATLENEKKALLSEKETLTKVNADLSKTIEESTKAQIEARKKAVIDKALSEGRILPKDKEYWEKKFSENPDFAAEVIEKLPKVVKLGEQSGTDEHETSDEGDGTNLSEDEQIAKNLAELGYDMSKKGQK